MLFDMLLVFMVGVILVAGASACGLLVVSKHIAPSALRILAGMPLFIIGGTILSSLPYLLGSTRLALTVLVCFALALVVVAFFRGTYQQVFQFRQIILLVILVCIGSAIMSFGWSEGRDGVIRTVPGGWGDGALHTLNAQYVANGPARDPLAMPAFVREYMREPFGYTLFAGILLYAGFSVGGAFSAPASLLLACLLGWSAYIAIHMTVGKLSRTWRIITYAIAGILGIFGGGLQWVVMATKEQAWNPIQFFGMHGPWDKGIEEGLVWANYINIFSSQKHILLAITFIVVLAGTACVVLSRSNMRNRKTLVLLAIHSGLLPFFHAHVFIGVAMLWVMFVIFSRKDISYKERYALLAIVGLIALPFFLWYTGAVTREGFMAFAPGYLAPQGPYSWAVFWVINLGAFPFIALFALLEKENRNQRILLAVPAGLLFLLGNTIQFQPYLWDNIKFFQAAWFLLLPLVIAELIVLASRRWAYAAIAFIVVASLSLTSLSEVARYARFRQNSPIYTVESRKTGEVLSGLIPPNAIVLAATNENHNHPVTLTGRQLVLGYGGWIWTRGIPLSQREDQIRRILQSNSLEALCKAAGDLGITHIVATDAERMFWSIFASQYVRQLTGLDGSGIHVTDMKSICP